MIKLHHVKAVTVGGRKAGLEATHFSGSDYLDILHHAEVAIKKRTTVFTSTKERVQIGRAAIEFRVKVARLGQDLPIYPED